MLADAPATFEAALLATEDWEELAKLIIRLSDSTDDERGAALIALASPDDLDWVPFLSLIVIRIVLRRMKGLEERFRHRVIDVSADALVNAISEGNHVKAEANARVAFSMAESLVNDQEEG